ncbi:MAG: N-acetylneuraminate synthase family protein [Patescibacteria group bacterium]|nr:N-acetylneuraminate synthase family protein [Patescibacteria group bacterium]MDE2218588.1 N-acetylneuraminate synthase family protein [Patescibacteria group bacterium]
MKAVKIEEFPVGSGEERTFIIAEIGINHNGDVVLAKKLIDLAVMSGCDAVKFQKRTVGIVYAEEELSKPRIVCKTVLQDAIKRCVLSREAEKRLIDSDFEASTNGDLKYALELKLSEYIEIDDYCKKKGIIWFASCWDEESVDFVDQFDPPCYKIASPSLTDDDLLRYTRAKGRPIILSTGMSDLLMIRHAVEVLGKEDLILLHCTSVYPKGTEYGEEILKMINLRGIETLRKEFDVPIGFSSHYNGRIPTFASVPMGACAIEVHITMEKSMFGSDQASSMEPWQIKDLCSSIRQWEIAKGDGIIRIYPEEQEAIKKLRRK